MDEIGEDGWTREHGALVPVREISLIGTNSLIGLAPLVVQPPSVVFPGHSLRLHVTGDTDVNTNFRLLDSGGGGTNLFLDSSGNYSFGVWPTNGAIFYVASHAARKTVTNSLPTQYTVELQLVGTNGAVVAADHVKLTIAPLILPPECNAAEAVYSSQPGITNIAELIVLHTSGDQWTQDQVKFTKLQCVSNVMSDVFVSLHKTNDNLVQVLKTNGLVGIEWPLSTPGSQYAGNGGNIMATPPVPGAPYGKILIGSASTESAPYWTAQGVQPVVTNLNTSWLAVGHIDEVIMFVATNKVLYGEPWKAADLLHSEIVAGHGTNTIWWGLNPKPNHQTNILAVTVAKDIFTDLYKTNSMPMDLPYSTTETNLIFNNHNFATFDRLRVGNEILRVVDVNGATVTVNRAQYDRPATNHTAGTFLYAYSDILRKNLPETTNSVVSIIGTVTNQVQQALGNYSVSFVPMPVLFEFRSDLGGYVAYSANTVNCLLGKNGTIYYSEPGCAVFRNDIATQISGAQAVDVWDLYHCEYGEIHCATAARRSLAMTPAWWLRVNNWE